MFKQSKLRGPVGRIYPITILSFYIIGVIEFLIRLHYIRLGYDLEKGPILSIIGVAGFFLVMGIYQYWRYQLLTFLILGIILGYSSFQSLFTYVDWYITVESYIIGIIVVVLYIVVTWPILSGHERYEAKTRRLFKLAVDQINETEAGFTARPFAAGNASFTIEEAQNFSRYLKSKHIVLPVYSKDGVFLMFSLRKSLMKNPEPEEVSYVQLWNSGEIRIHISAFDYKQYTKRYSFDQLCSSFGDVFRRFLHYYQEGHEDRILAELKAV
jgi:hypothetical protein